MAKYYNVQHNVRSFAPVAPVSVLQQLQEDHMLGQYNLILAHNIVEQKDAFTTLARKASYSTWLIDNSVIELGRPVDAKMIADAHRIISSETTSSATNVVCVLPDELLDCDGTIGATAKALIEFRRYRLDNLMFVPQGKTREEIIKCATAFQDVQEIKWIGVAKNFVGQLGSRGEITQILQSIFPDARFHMLGFSRNTVDDILSTRLPGVEGIDSSMPLRLDRPINFGSTFPKRGEWWKEGLECTQIMKHNIERVRKWLGGY